MKLLNLIPVTSKDLLDRIDIPYLSKYLPDDVQVDLGNISEGAPSIEDDYDEGLCMPGIIRAVVQAEKDGYDGVFISCFADPGVTACREAVNIPVYGGFETTTAIAMGLGDRMGILAIMPETVGQVRSNVGRRRLDDRVACIRNIGVPVLALDDDQRVIEASTEAALRAIKEDGADVIILGCTGMMGVTEQVQENLANAGYDVPVLEPGICGLTFLGMVARMGLRHNRITYMPINLAKYQE